MSSPQQASPQQVINENLDRLATSAEKFSEAKEAIESQLAEISAEINEVSSSYTAYSGHVNNQLTHISEALQDLRAKDADLSNRLEELRREISYLNRTFDNLNPSIQNNLDSFREATQSYRAISENIQARFNDFATSDLLLSVTSDIEKSVATLESTLASKNELQELSRAIVGLHGQGGLKKELEDSFRKELRDLSESIFGLNGQGGLKKELEDSFQSQIKGARLESRIQFALVIASLLIGFLSIVLSTRSPSASQAGANNATEPPVVQAYQE